MSEERDKTTLVTAPPHPTDGVEVEKLISAEEIARRVEEMGHQIREEAGSREIILLCILKGSVMFTSDLARAIPGPLRFEFLGVSSYGDEKVSSGAVKITHDLTESIEGKYVVIVEDILDTGLTLSYLHRVLQARNPEELRICTLLQKPSGGATVKADYVGFNIDDVFVVGYGLDWAQRLRNLPYIGIVPGD